MAQSLNVRAEAARETLFQRYDELNEKWLKAEEQLTELHIPRGVGYCYRSWDDGDEYEPNGYESHLSLGLQKVNGKWRICHGYYTDVSPDTRWTPITECSAEIRVEAARYFGKLREAVVESAEKFIPKVDEAINELYLGLMAGLTGRDQLAPQPKANGKPK